MSQQTVLLVEDEESFIEAVRLGLSREGFAVEVARDGHEALEMFERCSPDIVLLDVMLPKMSGIDVCRRLRQTSDVPIIMVTAKGSEIDTVVGLEVGADDYVTKPFDLGELFARLRALTRRIRPEAEVGDHLELGDLSIDPAGRVATRGGRRLELSKTEFDLLELLVRNAGIVLDHSTIYERIWNYDFGPDSKNLAVYIGYLRRKTETDGATRLIHTVRGVGYTLRDGDAA